jgi:hypothetical protein
MISNASVDRICSEVGQYSDEQMANEFDRFFRAQPVLCEFIAEVTHESGQKIQELTLFLSYMIFKTVEASLTPVRVHEDAIEAAQLETEAWMIRLSEAQEGELQDSIAKSLQMDTEPYLLQYVISELNDPSEEDGALSDEEKGEVFFVLKTVIASLCKSSN